MVGPSTKVDPATFPRRANLHWLGGRDYADLPAYAKCFEVCLMPFALNKATEFINPTKALEYMAVGKPIISTRVEDVVMQFSEVVVIAESHADFIAKAARYSVWPDQTRIQRGFELVKRNSWESIVDQLEKHVADTWASKLALAVNAA